MKTSLKLTFVAVAAVSMASCSSLGELGAENFKVTPTPLEVKAGVVEATLSTTIPEKYMQKKAIVTITPVLTYEGGEAVSASQTFQGESVKGNDETVSYKLGGNYTMRASFKYVPEMIKSDLVLRFDATLGGKQQEIPEVKVGYGVIATSDLLRNALRTTNAPIAPDAYQRIIAQKQEANIKFLINQAQLRQSELKGTSVQDFINMLKEINADRERLALNGIEVSAYASPDGAYAFNEKLAEKRQNVSADYVRKQMKTAGISNPVDTKYTAEDWDGFQQLVAASNIQDKEVILRVLSMYQDPEEREAQIHNMSSVFTELAEGILPELRRARLTINYQVIGRSDVQILAQYKEDASKLSLEELLYGANKLVGSNDEKEDWNRTIVSAYPNDYRAYNNLASLAYAKGDLNAMKVYLDKAASLDSTAAEVNTNRALLALAKGDVQTAESYLGRGTGANSYSEVLGNLAIAKGNYSQAASVLNGNNTNSAALAQILNNDYSAAAKTLANIKNADATTDYISAILCARTNDATGVANNLRKAVAKDGIYSVRAKADIEFANFADVVNAL